MNRGPARVAMRGAALDEVTARILQHFYANKPEPASFPAMASRVIDLAEHPDVDVSRLAHLIERDPAICTSVIAVANSAANRRLVAVETVRSAITQLGLKRVANIAVGVACRSLFDVELRVQHELFPNWWGRLFHAAMTEAFTASFVAMERHRRASQSIFLSAMLHDIGKLLCLRSLAALIIGGTLSQIPDDETIEELLQRTRVEIGVASLTAFNMPEALVSLCSHQDDEDLPNADVWEELFIVRLVAALNDLRMTTFNTERPILTLQRTALSMQLSSEEVLAVARQVSEHAAQVSVLFSTSDEVDETGYLEFVQRCVTPPGRAQ